MVKIYLDKEILKDIKSLLYIYKLNKVIRYNQKRKEWYQTQSVAEHVANLIFLAQYFREFEDPENKLNFEKIVKIITFHDLGEIETGDIPTIAKTDKHEKAEFKALKNVVKKSPNFVAKDMLNIYTEYENQTTAESKYVKALDKIEGQIFWVEKDMVAGLKKINKQMKLEIDIVHPKHIEKVHKMLSEYNFNYMIKFLRVIEKQKYSYGILNKKTQFKFIYA